MYNPFDSHLWNYLEVVIIYTTSFSFFDLLLKCERMLDIINLHFAAKLNR